MTAFTPEDVLAKFPSRILDREQRLWKVAESIDAAARDLKAIEAEVYLQVCSAMDGDGRKKYTNEALRDAAVQSYLREHDRAPALRESIEVGKRQKQVLEADREYLSNVQRNARVLVLSRAPSQLVFDTGEDLL